MTQYSIGIDISKDDLDAHSLPDGRAARFGNTKAGFAGLEVWLPAMPGLSRIVYEATGPCHAAFERQFAHA